MGWLKFTNSETGATFDSRDPSGAFNDSTVDENTGRITQQVDSEPMYRHPNGKDIWIDDPRYWLTIGKRPPASIYEEWSKELQDAFEIDYKHV